MILAGDVGGTKTNLALCDDAGKPHREATFAAKDYASLEAMVATFIAGESITAACFGVAGPVDTGAGSAKITNLPWTIRADLLSKELGGARVSLINDLQATALGALVIPQSSFAVLQVGDVPDGATIAVIAPGTGLGESCLYHDGTRYQALPSEGGHGDLPVTTDDEIELLRFLRGKYGDHVSVERVLSGNGVADVYDYYARGDAKPYPGDRNAAISDAGLAGTDPNAARALELFAQILGAECGNLALRYLATGGVVIGGGIPPKLLPVLQRGSLIERFAAKGRFADWLRARSVRVVLDPKAALLGAAHYASTTKDDR
ncbi:MAG TPA: glucokinase [Kofleriaceae bacterium]|nr:glucokinase [Kofleriaceae bacterium]